MATIRDDRSGRQGPDKGQVDRFGSTGIVRSTFRITEGDLEFIPALPDCPSSVTSQPQQINEALGDRSIGYAVIHCWPQPATLSEIPRAPNGLSKSGSPPLRILVVDDNVDSADSMALLLSLEGHQVQTAFDGLGALEAAEQFRPDAVLLDIGLPGMDGYEVARQIRTWPVIGRTLMIAVTGYSQETDRALSRAAGFDHHLVKPVDPDIVCALLGSLQAD